MPTPSEGKIAVEFPGIETSNCTELVVSVNFDFFIEYPPTEGASITFGSKVTE